MKIALHILGAGLCATSFVLSCRGESKQETITTFICIGLACCGIAIAMTCLEKAIQEKGAPSKRPHLRKYFIARRHPIWGAAVVWYEWSPLFGWGINWGISAETLQEARAIRKFLNGRVAKIGTHGGTEFHKMVTAIKGVDCKPYEF